jgi:hypothetical protein
MTARFRPLLIAAAACLAACQTSTVAATQTAPPPPPAFLKDLPSEVRNGVPVNFTQAKAGDALPPDPLRFTNGKRVASAKDWAKRREQILNLLQDNQYGRRPHDGMLHSSRASVGFDDGLKLGGLAKRQQMSVATETGWLDVVLYLPADAKGPVPVVLNIMFSPAVVMVDDPGIKEVDGWSADHKRIPGHTATPIAKPEILPYLARGYGVALVYYGQIEPDFDGGAQFGQRPGPHSQGPRGKGEWGSVAVWSYGLSRVLDDLELTHEVDAKRVALYGISRLGKTVLWAGAEDPRFAAVISVCSGEGGAALSRRDYGETIAAVAKNFPYWFAPRWNSYADNPAASPVDSNLVLSLIAPRPLLLITSSEDAWSDPYGEYLAARSASPVWELLGKKGLGASPYPAIDTPAGGDLAFMTHAGPHGPAKVDTNVILDFLDAHMK